MTLFTKVLLALGVASALAAPVAKAEDADVPSASSRLMIVNGDTDEVIYDDGEDDLFCVTHVHVGYNYYGRRVHHRTMRCR